MALERSVRSHPQLVPVSGGREVAQRLRVFEQRRIVEQLEARLRLARRRSGLAVDDGSVADKAPAVDAAYGGAGAAHSAAGDSDMAIRASIDIKMLL